MQRVARVCQRQLILVPVIGLHNGNGSRAHKDKEVMFSSLFVSLSVSNFAQKFPNGFA